MNDAGIPITHDMIEEMHRTYAPALRRRAVHMLFKYHDREDIAQDIVQDAWIRVLRAGILKNNTNIYSWLYTIVSNLTLDYLRRQKKRIENFNEVSIDGRNDFGEIYGDILIDENAKTDVPFFEEEMWSEVSHLLNERERWVANALILGHSVRAICKAYPMCPYTYYQVVAKIRAKVRVALKSA